MAVDVVVTGIGLATAFGEGLETHFTALSKGERAPLSPRFAPYAVHPMVELPLDTQIPRKGDQRQMEPWQRMATYVAGVALDAAGARRPELLRRMDLVVGAGGGERDTATDAAILDAITGASDPGALLNERLARDLRPTLFLAQLSNLVAGNISIVHGVVGSSRTVLGEAPAGADALRIAAARIAAEQSTIALAGAAYNAERADSLLTYVPAHLLSRDGGPGMTLGSAGCFLVLESARHAAERGAEPIARIGPVDTDRSLRRRHEASRSMAGQFAVLGGADAVISGASGAVGPTEEERGFLPRGERPWIETAPLFGHMMEATFPVNVALAALAVSRGSLFGRAAASRVAVTGWGHWRGEAMVVVDKPGAKAPRIGRRRW